MLTLTNCTLIDGTGRGPVTGATITVDGNRIGSVGGQRSHPQKATVVDLRGLVVMPGLIECHVHFGGIPKENPGPMIEEIPFLDMVSSHSYARQRKFSIDNGVTSIRSVGDFYPDIIRLRERIASGQLRGPRVFAAGPIFTAPGGHPASTVYKGISYIVAGVTREVDDVHTAREEVKRLAEGGVDYIKAIYAATLRQVPKLSLNVLVALADEAHKHNLRLIVDTRNPEDTMDAVKVGADSIEHGLLSGASSREFPDELIRLMRERGTFFVPTFFIGWRRGAEHLPALKRTVKRLYDAGVNIAAGTDAGAPSVVIGPTLHKEMELLVEAGLSPMAAIMAATSKAAENLGKQHQLGTIEKGKLADMVVVSGNPAAQISDTKNLKLVIKDGKILVDRLGLSIKQ
jgi:imidazolonepropionase-like amidohydrolase